MKRLEIVPHGFPCTLEECPVGLFLGGDNFDCLCLKTEYGEDSRPMCYIEESGERYCAQPDRVQPCVVEEHIEEE